MPRPGDLSVCVQCGTVFHGGGCCPEHYEAPWVHFPLWIQHAGNGYFAEAVIHAGGRRAEGVVTARDVAEYLEGHFLQERRLTAYGASIVETLMAHARPGWRFYVREMPAGTVRIWRVE